MDTGKKLMIGGTIAMLVGAYLISNAENSKIIIDGIERPNEGAYIRKNIGGILLAFGGASIFVYGIFKTN